MEQEEAAPSVGQPLLAVTQPDGTLRSIDVWESEELCAAVPAPDTDA
ncbi:hypothetical protein [Nonomuraea turcica]|nr:hypothetical protein [Nonomuraea sp. G32]MDP4508352.1 hypothetical protein [Nonomuraea sp. G32]